MDIEKSLDSLNVLRVLLSSRKCARPDLLLLVFGDGSDRRVFNVLGLSRSRYDVLVPEKET